MRSRIILASFLTLSLLAISGCADSQEGVFTYSQREGGSIAASDGVGSGMSRRAPMATASVHEGQYDAH